MATTNQSKQSGQPKLDVNRPFYAVVGAADLAVALGRAAATELQADAMALPTRLEKLMSEYVADLTRTVIDLNKGYDDLAARGHEFVAKVRGQEGTEQTKTAARTTTAKAKSTATQAKKSAKKSSTTAKSSTRGAAKKTSSTAKKSAKPATSSAKGTATAARKTVSSAARATSDAASKAGS